jgi:tetratricopeptide (TPR) repeat protein
LRPALFILALALLLPPGVAAARESTATVDNAANGLPDVVKSLSAVSTERLLAGDRSKALDAAREGIAAAARWKNALGTLPPWDGTHPDAGRSLDALFALFPRGEDTSLFLPAGRTFLSLSSLRQRLLDAEERSRSLERRSRQLSAAARTRGAELSARRARAERIGDRFRDDARRSAGIPRRVFRAADDASIRDFGERTDPKTAALFEEASEKLSRFAAEVSRLQSAARAIVEWQDARTLPPEDRRMVYFAMDRLARAEETAASLDAKLALLRARVWNRWKEAYVSRTTRVLDDAEAAVRRGEAGSARAARAADALMGEIGRVSEWEEGLAGMAGRMSGTAILLRSRHEELRAPADEAFSRARRSVLDGLARKERALRHLAGRAAAEWILEGKASQAGDASPPPAELLPEAILHLETSLPPPGERAPHTDESLYALAALRFEEAFRRYYGGKEGERKDAPDLAVPTALFRRLASEFPDSRYDEHARYALASCLQESGAEDNAVLVLEELLVRHPSTRYADEANLRIGEHRFDRYDFHGSEAAYRKVRDTAPTELRTTARFKLGWSLFLQSRPREAAPAFLDAALLASAGSGGGGLRAEARRMTARSVVEAGTEREAEAFLGQRRGESEGPAVLLAIEALLDAQNRYEEAAAVATRIGAAYPAAAERLDAEEIAAAALRKAKKDDESMARRGTLASLFGPGTAWRSAAGRTPGEISRADAMAMEGLAAAGFHFHAASRANSPGDRRRVLALYDELLAKFPSSPKAEEAAYQRAWLLYEDGRKAEALPAFESVARRPGGARGEAAWYMAVQCAKDLPSPRSPEPQAEVTRLAREYERAFPGGERLFLVRLDRARAHFLRKEWDEAAAAATRAGRGAPTPADLRTAYRIAGEAFFEAGRYAEAETAFRDILGASPAPEERPEIEKWVAFSMFRAAERLPASRGFDAGALFLRIAGEFPHLPIVPEARFRAGAAYADAGKDVEAIGAFLAVESEHASSPLAPDATRRLAALYEKSGNPLAAAERLARLSTLEGNDEGRGRHLFRAAELYGNGKDGVRSRRSYVDVSALLSAPPEMRVLALFRAGESALAEGREEEAETWYEGAVRLHREKGGAAPEVAGRALFQRAEIRYRAYLPLRIVPPLEQSFAAKQRALAGCADLYAEAIRVGDAATVSASFLRIGEGLEDFRAAILASPPPADLSAVEKEEYVFLLEERAAPIEERAVESYRNNLRQAVAVDHFDPSVAKSRERLRVLRPALFAKKPEFAFPVVPVPDFAGITERTTP